ncbi:microtubule-associated protein futsch-like [Anser cygnoides]|uniref:microtubule-associated protein futsch-like n=1 Tax=Anser cygnoides TaxID=8845 RepID=UPI0034D29F2E
MATVSLIRPEPRAAHSLSGEQLCQEAAAPLGARWSSRSEDLERTMEQQNKDHSQPAEGQQSVQEQRQFLLQMEKLQVTKTLPHSGVRQEERIRLPAVPPFPRQAATQAAAAKQVPAAQTSSSERVTCKLPPLQATASSSSVGGRAKALGTEAYSHQELLPPLPCISGDRDKAVRAESRERGPHSPVAPDEDMEYTVRSFVSTVIRNALACNEGANSKARLSPSGRRPGTKGYRTPSLTTAVPQNGKKKSQHSPKSSPAAPAEEMEDPVKVFVSTAISNAVARNQGAMSEARLSPLDRRPRSEGRITPPLLTAVPQNWKKSQHRAKNSPAASAEDMEHPVKAFVSSVISKAIACNEGAMREAELPPLCRGPRSKGHRTPPLLTAAPQDLKESRQAAPHCPTDSFTALRDTAQSLVSEVLAKTMAESWEHGQRPAELEDLAHTGCTATSTRAVQVQTDMDSRWTTALPGRHHQARSGKAAAGRAPAPASPDGAEKQGQQRQIHIKPRQGSGKDEKSQGRGRKESGPVGSDEEEEIVIFNSWINPRFPSLFQDPQAFPQEEGSSARSADREAAAQEAEPPTSASLGSLDTETSPACLAERHGTPLTATQPSESRPASCPSAPAFEDKGYRAPPQTRGEEIVIFNSWINPRFPSLFQDPQAFPQEEGSSASSVDREAAAEAAEPPTSASLGSLEPTDTAPSAARLAEGPGEERHSTPLTETLPAESRPASPPSAPALEDEGNRAPPLTCRVPESKPSACPTPIEHSTAVMVESQGRAQHASSACDEDLHETARIIVSAVLRHAVAMSQGATSKAPTAPSATGPSVPPPTAEPVDCTSSASALAGGAVGEATEAPLTAAAAPQEEVASPVTADLLREDITDLSPAAADEAGAAATPLAMVPGHQVAAEQGGQAQSSSCTKDMPADEPATSQAQALSQGLLAGPVQRSEQHQGLGILDLAQAPARQPRPSRLRRALRALRRAFCCSCIAGQRE